MQELMLINGQIFLIIVDIYHCMLLMHFRIGLTSILKYMKL